MTTLASKTETVKSDLRLRATTAGFNLSDTQDQKIYEALEEEDALPNHMSLGHRYRNWLKENDKLPGFNRTVHIAPEQIQALAKRAKNDSDLMKILDTVVEVTIPEHGRVLTLEQQAKKKPENLAEHAKHHGVVLTALEADKVFEALSDRERITLLQDMKSVDVRGVTTGNHGNAVTIPENELYLTPAHIHQLEARHPQLLEKVFKAISAHHLSPIGPKSLSEHAATKSISNGGIA